jgi:Spy/CpxP family protein refolding chaperone
MKKLALFAALAASLAGTQAVHAQAQHDSSTRGHGGRGGRGGPAMMEQSLLKNITLTDAQKSKLEQLHKAQRDEMQAGRGQGRGDFEAIQKARQSGDTATAIRLMKEQRTKMEARRDAHTAAIRAILTPDQQKQLDANLAELKKHDGDLGGRGKRQWNAQRPATA